MCVCVSRRNWQSLPSHSQDLCGSVMTKCATLCNVAHNLYLWDKHTDRWHNRSANSHSVEILQYWNTCKSKSRWYTKREQQRYKGFDEIYWVNPPEHIVQPSPSCVVFYHYNREQKSSVIWNWNHISGILRPQITFKHMLCNLYLLIYQMIVFCQPGNWVWEFYL